MQPTLPRGMNHRNENICDDNSNSSDTFPHIGAGSLASLEPPVAMVLQTNFSSNGTYASLETRRGANRQACYDRDARSGNLVQLSTTERSRQENYMAKAGTHHSFASSSKAQSKAGLRSRGLVCCIHYRHKSEQWVFVRGKRKGPKTPHCGRASKVHLMQRFLVGGGK